MTILFFIKNLNLFFKGLKLSQVARNMNSSNNLSWCASLETPHEIKTHYFHCTNCFYGNVIANFNENTKTLQEREVCWSSLICITTANHL